MIYSQVANVSTSPRIAAVYYYGQNDEHIKRYLTDGLYFHLYYHAQDSEHIERYLIDGLIFSLVHYTIYIELQLLEGVLDKASARNVIRSSSPLHPVCLRNNIDRM